MNTSATGASVDRDTHQVSVLLREAVVASGLTQSGFARALGTSAPRLSTYLTGDTRPSAHLLVRARRLGHALGAVADQGLMSAPATAVAMRRHLSAGEIPWVWRMLVQGRDHLALMIGSGEESLIDSWEAEPATVGSIQWDVLLAAVAAREFDRAGLAAPTWTRADPLVDAWIPDHPFLDRERVRKLTPAWLKRQNIFVPARDLGSA